MKIFENQSYDQERALYGIRNAQVRHCRFEGEADGESFLKECNNITVSDCFMDLRYPLWHLTDATITQCTLTNNCRAALWYDKNVAIAHSTLNGIKAIRECENITITNCTVASKEFIWKVNHLTMDAVDITESEYPFFEVTDATINRLNLTGKYSFQYCSDISITNCNLNTKDAFWHSKNVTVRDTIIKGEYLAWYSENLTLINCTIIGTQPFCYCKNLVLKNCTMQDCDLSFEKSTVKADIVGSIDSVKNPLDGYIVADNIKEIILDESVNYKTACKISTR